jgi:hypothetical protein
MTEEHVSADLRNMGRRLQSRLKAFFDNPLGADATPLELLDAALDDLERRIQPAGRGRRTFPYNRVRVQITQHGADDAAIQAVFAGLVSRLKDRLGELNCDAPDPIDAIVTVADGDAGAPAVVSVQCLNDGEHRPRAAMPSPRRPHLRLTVIKGQCTEAEYVFDEPVILIGRTAEPTDALGLVRSNHVAFADARDGVNETVARAQARLQFDEDSGHYVIFNESSSNPTSVIRAGRLIRVAPRDPRGVRVVSGDQLQLGRAVLRVAVE